MKRYSLIYKSILVLAALFGLVLQFSTSTRFFQTFSYYTVQSNLWVLIFFGVLLWFEIKKRPWDYPWIRLFKTMFTIGIFVTFLVYHFLLRPSLGTDTGSFEVGGLNDLFVHYIVPIMTLLDYLIFDPKGKMKWYSPLFNLIRPLDYVLYLLIYNLLGGRFTFGSSTSTYPYFFLDIDRFGFLGVLQWSVLILLLYLVLGFLLYFVDGLILYFQMKQNERRG